MCLRYLHAYVRFKVVVFIYGRLVLSSPCPLPPKEEISLRNSFGVIIFPAATVCPSTIAPDLNQALAVSPLGARRIPR